MGHGLELLTPRELPAELADVLEAAELDQAPDVIPDWVLTEPFIRPAKPACECGCHDLWPLAGPVENPHADKPLSFWAIPGVWDHVPAHPDPSPAVQALTAAAEQVCAADLLSLTGPQALTDAQALLEVGRRLRVHGLSRLADVQDRELHQLDGARSTAVWLKQVFPDADPADARLAGKLRTHRVLDRAVRQGQVSLTAAKKVLRALGWCRPHVDCRDGLIDHQPAQLLIEAVVRNVVDLVCRSHGGLKPDSPLLAVLIAETDRILAEGGAELDQLEAAFVLLAEHAHAPDLTGMLEELFLAVVPSELERRNQRAQRDRSFTLKLSPDKDCWEPSGRLSLELGERLWTALRAEARRDPDNPFDTSTADALRQRGIDPFDPEWQGTPDQCPRSRSRRLHDALDRLLTRYLEQGLGGTHHKQPVQIQVTVTEPNATGKPGVLPARADSGALIPRSMVRRWWCDSRVTAFILNHGGQALRTVHGGRTLTGRERQAMLVQSGNRCAGIGCCRSGTDPTIDLRPHHVRRFADDRRTSIEETVMICDTTHHDLHEGGKTIRLRDGRYLNENGWVDPASLQRPDAPF